MGCSPTCEASQASLVGVPLLTRQADRHPGLGGPPRVAERDAGRSATPAGPPRGAGRQARRDGLLPDGLTASPPNVDHVRARDRVMASYITFMGDEPGGGGRPVSAGATSRRTPTVTSPLKLNSQAQLATSTRELDPRPRPASSTRELTGLPHVLGAVWRRARFAEARACCRRMHSRLWVPAGAGGWRFREGVPRASAPPSSSSASAWGRPPRHTRRNPCHRQGGVAWPRRPQDRVVGVVVVAAA